MRRSLAILLSALMVLGGPALGSGTTINGSRTILGKWDASGATQTLPVKVDTSLPEACTVNEIFWLSTEVNGRGLYLCTATDTWTALGWGVGTDAPLTCAVGNVFFDTDATAGENLLVCTATDTWTTVGIIQSSLISGAGVSGQIAFWTGADSLSSDADLGWDGISRLTVTDLTVTNTITGSINGNAASADRASEILEPTGGNVEWGIRACGFEWQAWVDLNGDETWDAGDYGIIDDGFDTDGDCTADIPAEAVASTYATALKATTEANPMLYLDAVNNWLVSDLYAAGTGSDMRQGAATLIDSNGDGTLDMDVANWVGGTRGDGTTKQRWCTFPGGYTSDPFDYASGFCAENDSPSGIGAWFPVISDPNYATLSSPPYADLGTSTYKWRNGFFSNILYVGTALFNNIGYDNSYEGNTWSHGGSATYTSDNDYDDSAGRLFLWRHRTGAGSYVNQFRLDADATPEANLDIDGDGTPDIRFDGDEPANTESLIWNSTANAIRWGVPPTATALATDPTGCTTGKVVTDVAADGTLTCTALAGVVNRPWDYVEMWDDFLKPFDTGSATTMGAALTLRNSNVIRHEQTDRYDYDGTTTEAESAIGIMGLYTGTTNNNDTWFGFSAGDAGAAPSSLTLSVFQMKKMRKFRARWNNNYVDGTENVQLVVGGIGETEGASVSVAPDSKETGVYFFCSPDADIDDDGTAGDADDDNVWAVVDNNLGSASDTACLTNGTGACTPDANRSALNTGVECTGAGAVVKLFLVGEIEFNGTSTWTFRLDNDFDQTSWDFENTISATPSDLSSVMLWGVAQRNDNEATGKVVFLDYLYYYGNR